MFDARYHGSEIAALAWYRSYLVVYMGIVMKKSCHVSFVSSWYRASFDDGIGCHVELRSHVLSCM